jgi:hypothetical protein
VTAPRAWEVCNAFAPVLVLTRLFAIVEAWAFFGRLQVDFTSARVAFDIFADFTPVKCNGWSNRPKNFPLVELLKRSVTKIIVNLAKIVLSIVGDRHAIVV